MKKLLFVILIQLCFQSLGAQVYRNFMEAGKYAVADGNWRLAAYFLEEAVSQIPEDSIVDSYIASNRLRDIYKSDGRYGDALKFGHRCIEIAKSFGDEGKTRLLEDYTMQADIFTCLNDSVKAMACLDSALTIVRSPGLHIAYKKKFATLTAVVFSHLDNWQMAEELYELAVMYSRRFKKSDDTQLTLNLYGNALYHNSKYDEALDAYLEQRDVCEGLFGVDSRQYQWANYCVANILAFKGQVDEGSVIYKGVMDWYRSKILSDLPEISASEREHYLDNMIYILQNSIPFGIEASYNSDEFTKTAYEALSLTKGLLLATEKSTETIIQEYGTSEQKNMLSEVKALRIKLKSLLADLSSDPVEVLNTYAAIKTIDVKLAKFCSDYSGIMLFANIGYDEIRNSLKDGEVLLDFADFKPRSRPRQYVCYEIRRDQKYPAVHFVCTGSEIDSLLALESNRLSNLYSGEAAGDMATIVGGPLKEIIDGARTVYYVPSGIFHKLSLEAISDGDRILDDSYSFHRLSSARELAMVETNAASRSSLLYGGLAYGYGIDSLPHSLQEVTEISETINDEVSTELLVEDQGTKESFMDLSGSAPSILHLSTHGFYYEPSDPDVPQSLQGYDDAMSLSGLVMSGGTLDTKEGLLTADDVAGCNLSDAEIVCLAACSSGQGTVTSEGIYGLQRAFKKAGAQTLIMNLWKASDVATSCFMTNFYRDLIKGSKDCRKAFEFARNEVRRLYPSPFYWAGFVMID